MKGTHVQGGVQARMDCGSGWSGGILFGMLPVPIPSRKTDSANLCRTTCFPPPTASGPAQDFVSFYVVLSLQKKGPVQESKALCPLREKLYWTLESNLRRCAALTPFQGSLSYEAGSTDDRILLEVRCDSMGINMTICETRRLDLFIHINKGNKNQCI